MAEQYLCKSGESGWKKTVQMYCRADLWEDAHRVSPAIALMSCVG